MPLEPGTILVVFGPNNAGKSRALLEIHKSLTKKPIERNVVTHVQVDYTGDRDAAKAWMHRHMGVVLGPREKAMNWWHTWPGNPPSEMLDNMCLLATPEHRMMAIKPPPVIDPVKDPPKHPLHMAQKYPELESRVDQILRNVFGVGFTINWASGEHVEVHIGDRPEGINRVDRAYLELLGKLPRLEEQGDGLRAFVGCTYEVVLGSWSIVLMDEPEVFLHPPQARQLGRLVASEVSDERQLVVATHSADVLLGLLEEGSDKLKLVRLTRNGDLNHAHLVDSNEARQLASDPLLRFSRITDSLFHSATILCESDADCRFYEAVLSALPDRPREMPLFVAVGGKQAVLKSAQLLNKLGVPFGAVVDFDILNSERTLSDLCEPFGLQWSQLKDDWNIVRRSVETSSEIPLRGKLLEQLSKVLQGPPRERVSDSDIDRIKDLARGASGWARTKLSGLGGLPQGDAVAACKRLLDKLAQHGLHVVPCGELERFAPDIGGHSGDWVAGVLRLKNLASDQALGEARRFVGQVIARLDTTSTRSVDSLHRITHKRSYLRRMSRTTLFFLVGTVKSVVFTWVPWSILIILSLFVSVMLTQQCDTNRRSGSSISPSTSALPCTSSQPSNR